MLKKLLIFAAVFSVAVLAGLLRAPASEAQGGTWCMHVTAGDTPVVTGFGSNFLQAISNAHQAGINAAYNICVNDGFPPELSPCIEDFVVTTACWFDGSQWQISGYAKYKCREYL
jgi:ABC-type phosphate transport system substrate-binding protein